ncbi:hypothetical protein B0H11DRAFT_2189508 [Mycena galericulata]|nr:hypothetical protein B0H11DRAFT_2189508 [Mycena galericulata]
MKKRKEVDTVAKRPVGRPPKKPRSTAAAPKKSKPSTQALASTSRSTRQSTSASVSNHTSDSETIPNDIDMATIAILGKDNDDEDYADAKVEQEEKEEEEEEEEESDDECQEDEEEDRDFDLEFIIPVASNATDTIIFSSTITHLEFTQKVADEMNIRRKDLEIGYKLSHWTKDILPRVLTTPMHLIRLFTSAREELKARAESKKPSKKPLQVAIIDLRPKLQETKKVEKKPKSKASKKADSDSDDNAEGQTGKKTGPQYLRELEATHKCEKHTGFCLVAQNGEHVSLSSPNLSLWSMLCAQGAHESTSVPPPVLGLSSETGTKAAPPSRRPTTQQPPAPGPYPYSYYAPPGPYPQPYYPPPPPPPPIPAASPKSAKPSKPSMDSDDDDESPTLFPKIDDWLLDLDTSERGEDGHGFIKFGAALRDQGFARVVQLADLGGVAKLLMKYAKVDCKKVRKQEAERKAEWAA